MFFTCSLCGSSLKKNQVENHLFKCRAEYVTCLDCSVDFRGKSYHKHTTCISEDQKYGGSQMVHKENKGQQKQEQWIALVKKHSQIMVQREPQIANIMDYIAAQSNLPRKEKPFTNFMKAKYRMMSERSIKEIWNMMEEVKKELAASMPNTNLTKKEEKPKSENIKEVQTEDVVDAKAIPSSDKGKGISKKKRKKDKSEVVVPSEVEASEKNDGSPSKKASKKRKNVTEADNTNEETEVNGDRTLKKKSKKKKKREAVTNSTSTEVKNEALLDDNTTETQLLLDNSTKVESIIADKEEAISDDNGKENHESNQQNKESTFKWKTSIKQVLVSSPDNKIKLKRLQRKVIGLYMLDCGVTGLDPPPTAELTDLFNKKLEKNDKFILHDGIVMLNENKE